VSEHRVQRIGDKFFCAVCKVRWPCLIAQLKVIEEAKV